MGLSDKPADYDYRLASRIADIEALVASLGLRRVHLVVHDWGGPIGLGFAVRHPERVGRIAILNTAAFPSERIPARIALCRAPCPGGAAGARPERLRRGRHLDGHGRPAAHVGRERRGYLYPYDSWANRIGVHRFVRDIPMEAGHPSRPALEEVARRASRSRATRS
jgi:cis-3-alkyl-4-acyloxetan-2-one decarboxylase